MCLCPFRAASICDSDSPQRDRSCHPSTIAACRYRFRWNLSRSHEFLFQQRGGASWHRISSENHVAAATRSRRWRRYNTARRPKAKGWQRRRIRQRSSPIPATGSRMARSTPPRGSASRREPEQYPSVRPLLTRTMCRFHMHERYCPA